MKRFFSFLRDDRGVSALEYAILAGVVIAAVSLGVAGTDGQGGMKKSITQLFTTVNTSLDTAAGIH